MNSYRRGLRNGVLVNPKLFILEKVNLGPHTNYWSNLVKRVKNLYCLVRVVTLKVHCEVPDSIDLRLTEETDESTLNGEHNVVFFTREHLAARLRFPLPAIVKRFLHFTRAPPDLIHPNVIRILVCCCVLNHLYQLDLTLVELFIIYLLNIESGG